MADNKVHPHPRPYADPRAFSRAEALVLGLDGYRPTSLEPIGRGEPGLGQRKEALAPLGPSGLSQPGRRLASAHVSRADRPRRTRSWPEEGGTCALRAQRSQPSDRRPGMFPKHFWALDHRSKSSPIVPIPRCGERLPSSWRPCSSWPGSIYQPCLIKEASMASSA